MCQLGRHGAHKHNELTIGDANDFSVIRSIFQELGLSVGHLVQPDICRFLIDYQPVVFVMNFGVPGGWRATVRGWEEKSRITHRNRSLSETRRRDLPYLTLVTVCWVSVSIAA